MRSYILTGTETPTLKLTDMPAPAPTADELVVEIHATSMNYRDILQAQISAGTIPLSDGAGIVKTVGANVTTFKPGDRVVIGFMPGWVEGEFSAEKQASSLGGNGVHGVLAEQIVVPAAAVSHIPATMSFEAAATLPCAGVTAWSALFERRPIQPGENVLLLGTGGVSIFALQLAKMAGANVIITSSSDEKLERAKTLGADHAINYRTHPDWAAEVCRLTNGIGADLAIDVAGPATLNQTLKATRHGGRISLMGVLTGFAGDIDTAAILEKRITLQGIYVGPVSALKALAQLNIEPQIDRIFKFEEAEEAFTCFRQSGHFGKVVIKVRD